MNTWRDLARPRIAKILAENDGKDLKDIRKALKDAYPFGQREYWPYRVWCDEIRYQLGLKKTGRKIDPVNPKQLGLFKI